VGAEEESYSYIKWLDEQAGSGSGGVIYVSFGTQSHLSEHQMDEIAFGLEMAGHPFIWIVRSTTWVPPDGWNERVGRRGLVVQDWVNQRSILAHLVTGGQPFLLPPLFNYFFTSTKKSTSKHFNFFISHQLFFITIQLKKLTTKQIIFTFL
jgi:hypothetical protein